MDVDPPPSRLTAWGWGRREEEVPWWWWWLGMSESPSYHLRYVQVATRPLPNWPAHLADIRVCRQPSLTGTFCTFSIAGRWNGTIGAGDSGSGSVLQRRGGRGPGLLYGVHSSGWWASYSVGASAGGREPPQK